MRLNVLRQSNEDCMIFPTKVLFGNVFVLNIIFVFQEVLCSDCKRFIKKTSDLLIVL